MSRQVAGSKGGTTLTFAEKPVAGSCKLDKDCTGTANVTPKGHSGIHFSLVVADCGKEMLGFLAVP